VTGDCATHEFTDAKGAMGLSAPVRSRPHPVSGIFWDSAKAQKSLVSNTSLVSFLRSNYPVEHRHAKEIFHFLQLVRKFCAHH
jgi:hypothetical protein